MHTIYALFTEEATLYYLTQSYFLFPLSVWAVMLICRILLYCEYSLHFELTVDKLVKSRTGSNASIVTDSIIPWRWHNN